MTTDRAARIAEITRRHEKTTPGKWEKRELENRECQSRLTAGGLWLGDIVKHDDSEFIAHAHQDVPWLLDDNVKLAADNARLRAERAAAFFLAAALQAERDRVAELEKLVYVPGVWKCAKCGCVLVSSIMDASSGNMAANTEPQRCPNDCGPMWRRTEREAGNELCDRLERSAQEGLQYALDMGAKLATLEAENARLRAALEPFAKLWDQVGADDRIRRAWRVTVVTTSDAIRKARSALMPETGK